MAVYLALFSPFGTKLAAPANSGDFRCLGGGFGSEGATKGAFLAETGALSVRGVARVKSHDKLSEVVVRSQIGQQSKVGVPMREPFGRWYEEFAADDLTIAPTDINQEANGNLWSFSLSADRADVSIAELAAFIDSLIEARRASLVQREVRQGAMLFYVWHDAMAQQLRVSMVSVSHGRLPFSGPISIVEDVGPIIRSYLSQEPLTGAAYSSEPSTEKTEPGRTLVWCVPIP